MNFISLLSYEFITIVITILVVILFKLSRRFYITILSNTQLYLPPNDNDYKIILDLKKNKEKGNAVVRSCDIKEYIEKSNDNNILEFELIIFFYVVCFISLIVVEVLKYFELSSDDETIVSSFCCITILYILYSLYRNTFKYGYRSYHAKIFY